MISRLSQGSVEGRQSLPRRSSIAFFFHFFDDIQRRESFIVVLCASGVFDFTCDDVVVIVRSHFYL